MLKKNLALACVMLASTWCSLAQEAQVDRKSDHYVGIQANQLLRQIFNLGGNNAVVNNPYLMTYAVNNKTTGVGVNLGFGFTYDQRVTDDQFVDRTTTTSDLFFRFGFEKKSTLAPKLIISTGVDLITEFNKSETNTGDLTQPGGDFSSGTKSSGFGGGPRVSLNYAITEKIIVATEANYYFKSFSIKDFSEGSGFNDSNKRQLKTFRLNVPAVIFLILKF